MFVRKEKTEKYIKPPVFGPRSSVTFNFDHLLW